MEHNLYCHIVIELDILELKTKFSILLCTPLYHQGSRKVKNLAGSIMNYLNGRKIREISDEEIKFNLKKDLGTDNGKLRQNIALSFIKSLLRKEVSTEKAKGFSSSQIFQGADPKQSANDLVHRPIPHLWGADLGKCTFSSFSLLVSTIQLFVLVDILISPTYILTLFGETN